MMATMRNSLLACMVAVLALVGCGEAPENPAGDAPARGAVGSLGGAELQARIEAGNAPLILDVRTPDEFAAGHIPGAVNIPHTEVGDRLFELGDDKTREIVVHCKSGRRADAAQTVLLVAGYTNVAHLEGDMQAWQADGRPMIGAAPP